MNRTRWSLLVAGTLASLLLCTLGLALGARFWYATRPTPPAPLVVASATPVPATAPLSPPPTGSPVPAATPSARPIEEPAPTRAPLPPPPATPDPAASVPLARARAAHTLEAVAAATVPQRDLYEIALRLGRIPPDTPRVLRESDPGYAPGDTRTFNVSNLATEERLQSDATLRAQTAHASWWVEDGMTVNQADLEASAQRFEAQTYPTNRALFGSEWSPGIDGDPRVHIFLGEVPGVGGYYSSADEFPRSVNPFSNEMEIFYINLNNARPGTSYFDGILAHEFQHMIHWYADRNETLWINEGLSELASKLNGFEVGTGAAAFARQPDLPLTHWLEQSHPFYGSAFLFQNYFYQRKGEAAVTALVQEPADGSSAFDALLAAEGGSFNALFADWVVANLLDDPTVADGRFDYADDAAERPAPARTVQEFPLRDEGEVHQYGTDYLRFEPGSQSGTLVLEFEGEELVPLLPADAPQGEWMAWSNRGDDGDSTLTRAFDLRGTERATFRFRVWYDLERDYDYSYLLLSEDGGAGWRILQTSAMTDSNPHGNSFGAAWTARSGTAEEDGEPRWVTQEVDLSPWAGQGVLLRFETITDDALNQNGLAVDDLSIPELGYQEGFEEGLGGWEGVGYVRVDNLLPQRWIVQTVVEGATVELQRPALDEANRLVLSIPNFGTEVDTVTLLLSGSTPFTTGKARYRYAARIEPGE